MPAHGSVPLLTPYEARAFIFADNARSTLAQSIGPSDTTIHLASGTGGIFPAPQRGQIFALTLCDTETKSVYEVAFCTSRVGDTLTVERGKEGTTAKSWVLGDLCWNGPTAGQMRNTVQSPSMFDYSIAPKFDQILSNAGIWAHDDITSGAGHVRAAVGASTRTGGTLWNDPYVCPIIADYWEWDGPLYLGGGHIGNGNNFITISPNGVWWQGGSVTSITGQDWFPFNMAFPNQCIQCWVCPGAAFYWTDYVIPQLFGVSGFNRTSFAVISTTFDEGWWHQEPNMVINWLAIGN